MIHIADLSKSYGPIEALRDVSFHIAPGEIVGLLGPNGAGKTTIIKILTGYLQPDNGTVQVDGLEVMTNIRQVQERIGYLPETAPLYPELSIQSYLKMMAELRQIPEENQIERLAEAVTSTGLQNHLTRPIGHLSKGFRQRVGLAQAILHRPRLLILDEPTIGLDPTQIVEIRRLIKRLAENSTVLFSTHILSEVEALCDRVIILINGQVKADAHLADLASTGDAVLILEQLMDGADQALKLLDGVDAVETVRTGDGFMAYQVKAGNKQVDLCPAIYRLARDNDWPVRELRRDAKTLESVFNELATAA
ncbi:MAG: ATP-binding cassette domain-containing protein [Anaerolineales bacterium]|nr:ATP-binding cassette domain-containing protein [Anaerolineales bacterium]